MDKIYDAKSECNLKCAEWACLQSYYDVAVSRLYYSLYQKCIKLLAAFECSAPRNGSMGQQGQGSHERKIEDMISLVDRELKSDEEAIRKIKKLNFMRISRNKADYKPQETSELQYRGTIYPSYLEILSVIKKLEEIKEGRTNGC